MNIWSAITIAWTLFVAGTIVKSIKQNLLSRVIVDDRIAEDINATARNVMCQLIILAIVLCMALLFNIIAAFGFSSTTLASAIGRAIFFLLSFGTLPVIATLSAVVFEMIISLQTKGLNPRVLVGYNDAPGIKPFFSLTESKVTSTKKAQQIVTND